MAGTLSLETLHESHHSRRNNSTNCSGHRFYDKRTAKLWRQYLEMVEILISFIKSDRTGNRQLHLKMGQTMFPFLATAGHSNYAKSLFLYLQNMHNLQETHPEVYMNFEEGYHVIRRSDRYWDGLSADMIIEHGLIRSLKATGGLTRWSGMTESQRLVWLLSTPAY